MRQSERKVLLELLKRWENRAKRRLHGQTPANPDAAAAYRRCATELRTSLRRDTYELGPLDLEGGE